MEVDHCLYQCKLCGSNNLTSIIDYGKFVVADILLTEEQVRNIGNNPEQKYQLKLLFCSDCWVVQLSDFVPPELIYNKSYPYYSSVSNFLNDQSQINADQLINKKKLNENSTVIEIASNDGYLLKHFKKHGINVLGIDPAVGPAKNAVKENINTINDFFTYKLAVDLSNNGVESDLLIANNVLAHIPDINDCLRGVKQILKKDGIAVFEVHYVREMIEKCEFDTVYHQHCYYFSVLALDKIFRRNELFINNIKFIPNYGGSLRFYVNHHDDNNQNVLNIIDAEKMIHLDNKIGYDNFSKNAMRSRSQLYNKLLSLKNSGCSIVGYGAAAKASTLLNFCEIGSDILDYIVDKNQYKHGLFMGGNHLIIEKTEKLLEDMPDYVLILAWNYQREIIVQEAKYLESGGKFIIPIPNYKVIQVAAHG